MKDWFYDLTGFRESADAVYRNLSVDGLWLRSHVNGWTARVGELWTPTLGELRYRCEGLPTGRIEVSEVEADVSDLHADPGNAGALFQVASQFNLLEMASPAMLPEDGVTGYQWDGTQGPACAMACGAGTIWRNWFVYVKGQTGQSKDLQLDMLADVASDLENYGSNRRWSMVNGYALLTLPSNPSPPPVGDDHDMLRIGVQFGTQVTLPGAGHLVSQAYCSGLPLAYSGVSAGRVERLARMVLNSAYDATLLAARLHHALGASPVVYLTRVGGGAFGNPARWVDSAVDRALALHRDAPLDVRMVLRPPPR